MTNQEGGPQVEGADQRGKILGEGVVVVSLPGLAGPAMAAAIEGHATKAVRRHEHHLVVPDICGERPAMADDDGCSAAPVLVVDLGPILAYDEARPLADRARLCFRAARVLGVSCIAEVRKCRKG